MENKCKDIVIIHEDDDILVINKPSGLIVHPDGKNEEPALTDWIMETYPAIQGVGENIILSSGGEIKRPGIVHRLDRDTSGVLLIAKHQKSYWALKKLFQDKKILKVYKAIVYGTVADDVGVIEKSIGRNKKDFRLRSTRAGSRGVMREARTEYHVRERLKEYSFLDVYPRTGRTHQVRVHLASLGHPVVCDSLYAEGRVCPEELGRLGLHASSLTLQRGEEGEQMFSAPLPAEFKAFRNALLPKV